jgi:hypothetical protein
MREHFEGTEAESGLRSAKGDSWTRLAWLANLGCKEKSSMKKIPRHDKAAGPSVHSHLHLRDEWFCRKFQSGDSISMLLAILQVLRAGISADLTLVKHRPGTMETHLLMS